MSRGNLALGKGSRELSIFGFGNLRAWRDDQILKQGNKMGRAQGAVSSVPELVFIFLLEMACH